MKISIAVSLLILAAGIGLGWHDRQQLAAFRTTQRQLAAEAAKLGVSPDAAQNPIRTTKRERSSRTAAAKLSTAELIGLAKELERLNYLANFHAMDALRLRIYDSLSAMDSAGIKALLAETSTNPDLGEMPRMMLEFCCTTAFANDHPQAALEIFTSSPELFTTVGGRSLVLTALVCLAKDNLPAALDWVRDHPQHYADDAKGEIISAVAEQDAPLAFRLITELDFKISEYAIGEMLNSPKTLEGKSAALAGLREYLATIPDEKARDEVAASSIGRLAEGMNRESFESATRWISGQNLTPQELGQFAKGLNIPIQNGEAGRWIEWLHQEIPSAKTDQKIQATVHQWTQNDHQAVSKWLGTLSEGPVRNTAIRGYAETIAPYQPETAAQWAVTLPPGKEREKTLGNIHRYWPENDPAGKAAFARQHGIK
jgi:hypothetical protein